MVIEKKGKASVERPWMNYYPPFLMKGREIPDSTVLEYLKDHCPGDDVTAMHYYGKDYLWKEVWEQVDAVAASLYAIGFREGDQIPSFLRSVPEYIFLLLAAEKIGASLVCRDNTLEENIEAVRKSGAKVIFAHDFMSMHELEAFLNGSETVKAVLLSPYRGMVKEETPEHIHNKIRSLYTIEPAGGPAVMSWDEFIEQGRNCDEVVYAEKNIDRPLYRCYTSGSTGPSKQVIHSAHTMLGDLHQMNFYGFSDGERTRWLQVVLPPCLIAVTVPMLLMPLGSDKLLIMDPFCDDNDVDLELMRYKPMCMPAIPKFSAVLMNSDRIPDDFDMSFLSNIGAGAEHMNNAQLEKMEGFLKAHNSSARFTVGYGCSEAGSSITLPMSPKQVRNGYVGVPLPLTVVGVFEPDTENELDYGEIGEICISGPGVMMGYDNVIKTEEIIKYHEDGMRWLHTGDIGYMEPDGSMYILNRGSSERYGYEGSQLSVLIMENKVADAQIEGMEDLFFTLVPNICHEGYFEPVLYVVLKDGYSIDDIRGAVNECLEEYMRPMNIIQLDERPFFHFKTARRVLVKEYNENNKDASQAV